MARVEYTDWAVDSGGNVQALAAFEVRDTDGNLVSTLYAAETGATTVTNPGTADADGKIEFWINPGVYDVTIGSGGSSVTRRFYAPAQVNFVSRAELEASYVNGMYPNGTIISDGTVYYQAQKDFNPFGDIVGLNSFGDMTVNHFGAVGDFNGSTGTDDTDAINTALLWWVAAEGRKLVFPAPFWYYYDGTFTSDLGDFRHNQIVIDGQVTFGAANQRAWTFRNGNHLDLQIFLRNGGALGDFSTSTPTGGTVAITLEGCRWPKGKIYAANYKGRVIHFKDDGISRRCSGIRFDIVTGNRPGGGDARCGQAFYADTGAVANVGALGKINWRGEGSHYGPVVERYNDFHSDFFEAGEFIDAGPEFRGVQVAKFNQLYIGENDAGTNDDCIKFIPTAGGRKCADIQIDYFRGLRSARGIYAKDFETVFAGLHVGYLNASGCTYAIEVENMESLVVDSLNGHDVEGLLKTTGNCGNIDVNIGFCGAVTGDVVSITGINDRTKISGSIRGGAGAGFSLVNLGSQNTRHYLDDLVLDSSTCDQLVNIGFAGSNAIRMEGGSMTGTSAPFTSGRRPEYISGVRGLQTEAVGSAVIASGTNSVTFSHGLDLTPQMVSFSGIGAEVSQVYISSITSTQVTASVPANTTANRTFYWKADAVMLRNDLDA